MAQNDEFGYHELIDRASVLNDMWEDHIVKHGALEEQEELRKEAAEISDKIYKFYTNAAKASDKKFKE